MKQTCSWCGRDRKGKHFSNGSADCNDCVNQQAGQRLAGSGPNPNSNQMGLPPGLAGLLGNANIIGIPSGGGGHMTFGPGAPTNCLPPPKPKKKKKEPTGPVYRAVEEVSTFVESGLVKRIELQLEYGMNDQGMPLTETERAELQKDFARLTFQSEEAVDESEEAEALKSILGEP